MKKPEAVDLHLGQLRVQVLSSDTRLITGLNRLWQGFLGKGSADCRLQVELVGEQRSSPWSDQGLTWREGSACFTALGYEGWIDLRQGEGRLRLSSRFPLEDVDYFVRVAVAMLAFDAGGVLFHAAGILRGEGVVLFYGPSGAGKTTVARHSPAGSVLNDDLVLMLPEGNVWMVFATPFWNPTQALPASQQARLLALFRLVQDLRVLARPLTGASSLAAWLASVPVLTTDPTRNHQLLQLGQRLLGSVPAYELHFLPDSSFWAVVDERI
ncbi:MAG: hypothetical protein AB1345_04580 [Chloroflexota bacterium]